MEKLNGFSSREELFRYYTLDTLNLDEVERYINSCLHYAEVSKDSLSFTRKAVEKIYTISRGNPGVVNRLCQQSLLQGYSRHMSIIDDGIISEIEVESDSVMNHIDQQPKALPYS